MSVEEQAITRRLARFCAGVSYAGLPAAVVEMARRSLVDWVGMVLGGSREPLSPILQEVVQELGGHPHATLIGLGTRTSAANAALVNGCFAHSLEYDDVHHRTSTHPSAPVWAATLAVAEWRGSSAEEATAAFVAGYEVVARLGLAVGPAMIVANFHPTAHLGYFGAAAAAGRLLGLSEEAMGRAFGIAAGQAGGLTHVRTTMCKPFYAGHSAQGGVLSALMAAKGFDSVQDVLEGSEGLLATYAKGRPAGDEFEGLGEGYELLNNSFKAYPSCGMTHALVDCLLEIRRKAAPNPSEVEEIRAGMFPYGAREYVNRPKVETGLSGKFSGQYCAAAALLDGEVQLRQFTDERARDQAIQELMKRVRLVPVEGMRIDQAEVEVRLKDGRTFSHRVEAVSGSPDKPMSWNDLSSKFESAALVALPADRVASLLDRLATWPKVEIRELLALTVMD